MGLRPLSYIQRKDMNTLNLPADCALAFLNNEVIPTQAEVKGVSGIYAIVNKTSGKAYVGSAVDVGRRWIAHKVYLKAGKHNPKMQRAYDKYGADSFVWVVLSEVPVAELLMWEQEWINETAAWTNLGYNIRQVPNSNLGIVHSEETKARMKAAWTDEMKAASKARSLAIVLSDEQKQKIIAAVSTANKGSTRTLESREKMAQAKRGKKRSPETLAKIEATIATRGGRKKSNKPRPPMSAEQKAKIGASVVARAAARKLAATSVKENHVLR